MCRPLNTKWSFNNYVNIFCHFLTPHPPERGQKPILHHLVHIVIEWPLKQQGHIPYLLIKLPHQLFFSGIVKPWKSQIVSALSFPLYNKNLNSFLTGVRKVFKGGKYSREETIWGNTVHTFQKHNKTGNFGKFPDTKFVSEIARYFQPIPEIKKTAIPKSNINLENPRNF